MCKKGWIIFTKNIILRLTKKVQKDEIKEGINAPPNYGKKQLQLKMSVISIL